MNNKIELLKQKAEEKQLEQAGRYGVHPVVFTVWLLIIASVMLFAAFVSAYIVHRADGLRNEAWLQFELPMWFWVSAGIVVVSSFLIQRAVHAAKNDDIQLIPSLIVLTIASGLLFGISQYLGWSNMTERGLFLSNQEPEEISASFVYVISFVHLAHILLGLILLSVTLSKALKYEIHKKSMVFITISSTYWHFLGLLWICILLFLYFAR